MGGGKYIQYINCFGGKQGLGSNQVNVTCPKFGLDIMLLLSRSRCPTLRSENPGRERSNQILFSQNASIVSSDVGYFVSELPIFKSRIPRPPMALPPKSITENRYCFYNTAHSKELWRS